MPGVRTEANALRAWMFRLPAWLTVLAVALGLLEAWSGRNTMNPDGISYIEIGQQYLRGAWGAALNSYWAPLYSWTVGAALALLRPPVAREFAVVHAVNFLVYLLALFAFRFLLANLIAWNRSLPRWTWQVLGYAVFLSCSLDLITLDAVSPDLAVSAFVYLICGLMIRIRRGKAAWPAWVALGAALGFGYLTKSILFPFGLAVLAVVFAGALFQRKPWTPAVVAAAVFALIAGPYILAISLAKHRPTFGDNARLTYLFTVNRLPYGYPHGEGIERANLRHPPRLVHSGPKVYAFDGPVPGSCPAWYDATYWYEGLAPHFSARGQVREVSKGGNIYAQILLSEYSPLIAALAAILLLAGTGRALAAVWRRSWPLLVPSLLVLAAYLLVNVQGRLIGPFLAIVWLALAAGIRMPASARGRRAGAVILTAAAAVVAAGVTYQTAVRAAKGVPYRIEADRTASADVDRDVAGALPGLGIRPGDRVAVAGDSIYAYWAHMAGVRIAAEIPAEELDSFLTWGEPVLRDVARTGAKALIADREMREPSGGWKPIGGTGYWIRLLDQPGLARIQP